jgi:hypothetical protein
MTQAPDLQVPFRRRPVSDTLAKRRMEEALDKAPVGRLAESQGFRPRNVET